MSEAPSVGKSAEIAGGFVDKEHPAYAFIPKQTPIEFREQHPTKKNESHKEEETKKAETTTDNQPSHDNPPPSINPSPAT